MSNASQAISRDGNFELPREFELLLDRAAQGELDEPSQRELLRLVPGVKDSVSAYDAAAAELLVASLPLNNAKLSSSLEQRLLASGQAWCKQRAAETAPPLVLRGPELRMTNEPAASARGPEALRPMRSLRILPWLVAAASIALVAVAWWTPFGPGARPGPVVATTQPVSAEKAFAEISSSTTALQLAWNDWSDASVPCEKPGVKGSVVWDEASNRGVMKFENLPALDETKERYQLWIIDSRGMEQRISGGVFNGAAGNQFVVIDPGIDVDRAAAFAITIERPDGVWVSDMKRRVVIAAKS
jgi:hypothetical protein